ncbi:hypothetical protein [Oceanobacillus profundus]|nr:hypothetical protein [Oceanobacillus profundus]
MITHFVSNEFYSSMLEELENKKEKIAFILQHFPDTRENDNLLCSMYWKLVENVEHVDDIARATKSEVIRRARQKIQNERGLYLPSDPDVIRRRRLTAIDMRENIHTV